MIKLLHVKIVSKCLAHMKGCWDPEFKPSVEEIVDYRSFFGKLVHRGDFPIQSSLFEAQRPHGRLWSHPGMSTRLTYIDEILTIVVQASARYGATRESWINFYSNTAIIHINKQIILD